MARPKKTQVRFAATAIFYILYLTGNIFSRAKIWLASATTSENVENAGEGTLLSSSRK